RQNPGDAGKGGNCCGDGGCIIGNHQHFDRAERTGPGDDAGGGGGEAAKIVIGQHQNGHQSASMPERSAAMKVASSPIEATTLPATRSAGGEMLSTIRRGARSTPNSAAGRTASGLERAFI